MVKEYENDQIVVYWDPQKCAHAGHCWMNLPDVFKPSARPWVSLHAASPEEIIRIIDKCPSGALSYALTDGSTVDPALGRWPGCLANRMAGATDSTSS